METVPEGQRIQSHTPPRRVNTRNSVKIRFSPLRGAEMQQHRMFLILDNKWQTRKPGLGDTKQVPPKGSGVEDPSQKDTGHSSQKSIGLWAHIVDSSLSRHLLGRLVSILCVEESFQTAVKMKEKEEKGTQGFHQVPL